MRGFTLEQLVAHLSAILVGAPALLLLWYGLRRAGPRAPTLRELERIALVTSGVSLALSALVLCVVLRGRAIVDDELVYRMQAALLAQGKLALDVPVLTPEVFTIQSRVGLTGKYLFGEPLVQIPGALIGLPAIAHIPLAALSLLALHRATRLLADRTLAAWAVLFVACSPMFILTTATAQSQATSLFCLAIAGLGYAEARERNPWAGAIAVAMGIGFGVSVRAQVAVPAGLVAVPMAGISLFRRRAFGAVAAAVAVLAAWAVVIGAYDRELTGSALRLPWYAVRPIEHYGFGQVWDNLPYRHTVWRAVQNQGVVLVRFNLWWLGWPASLLLVGWWLRGRRETRGARIWLWSGAALIAFEFFYYSTGVSDTGPIYHYELLLPAALLAANAVHDAMERDPRATGALLAIHFGLGTLSTIWLQTARLDRLVSTIHDDVDQALATIEPPAVVFHEPLCTESVSRGWMRETLSRRDRAPWDPIVTYPRPPPSAVRDTMSRFQDRACWYFRVDPRSQSPRVLPCSVAAPLFERPTRNPGRCLYLPSTAQRLGYYDPLAPWRE
jgi:hypothetical protein